MHSPLLTYSSLGLFLVALIARLRERRATELHATVAESLGVFLFSTSTSAMPLGCAPSPEPRSLYSYKPGLVPVSFEFGGERVFSVAFTVTGSLFKKQKRIDLVLTPGPNADALHVTISADGRPPVYDGDVAFAEATKEKPFLLGEP